MHVVPPTQNPGDVTGDDGRTMLITQDKQRTDDRRTKVGNQCILSPKGGAAKTEQLDLRKHIQKLETSKSNCFCDSSET